MNEAVFALFYSTFGTFINSLAMILFKLAHLRAETHPSLNYHQTWQFPLGFLFLILGALISISNK